jgi:hypothetical protein
MAPLVPVDKILVDRENEQDRKIFDISLNAPSVRPSLAAACFPLPPPRRRVLPRPSCIQN